MLRNFLKPFKEDKAFAFLAVAILFVPLVFSRFTFEKFETIKFPLFYLFTGLALVLYVRGKQVMVNGKFSWALAILVVWSFAVSIFAVDQVFSFYGRSLYWFGSVFVFVWAIFVFILHSLATDERKTQIYQILVFAGLVNAVLTILQAFSIGYYESPYTIGYLLRAPALFGNPNYVAIFLAGIVPFAIKGILGSKTFVQKIYSNVAAFGLLFAVTVLASRGAILGLFASLAVMIVFALAKKNIRSLKYLFAYTALSLVLFYLFTGAFRSTYTGTGVFDAAEENVITRIIMWQDALEIIGRHPLIGIGFGNLIGSTHDSHNLFLNLGVSGGIPLVMVFVVLMSYAGIVGLRQYKNSEHASYLLAAFLGLLISASFNPLTIPNWMLLGTVLAFLASESETSLLPISSRVRTSSVLVSFLVIAFGACLIASQSLLYVALKANVIEKDFPKANRLLVMADWISPNNDMTKQHLAGTFLYLDQDPQKIADAIVKYKALHPKDPDVLLRVGRLYFFLSAKTGDEKYFLQAVNEINRALAADAKVPNGYFNLAYYYHLRGDAGNALATVKEGLIVMPNDVPLWTLATNLYLAKGDADAATESVETLYRLDPRNKIIKHALAKLKEGQLIDPLQFAVPNNPFEDFVSVYTTSL